MILKTFMASIFVSIIDFFEKNLDLKHLVDIFVIIGGLLGFFTYFHQFLRKFSPRIDIAGDVIFNFINTEGLLKPSLLDTICCNIVASNSNNSYGIIEDIQLLLYSEYRITPFIVKFFPKTIENTQQFFSPIVLQPKSFYENKILFKGDISSVPGTFFDYDDRSGLGIDIYIKISSYTKWKFVKKIHLYNKQMPYEKDENPLKKIYSVIDNDVKRSSLAKSLKEPQTIILQSNYDRIKNKIRKFLKSIVLYPGKLIIEIFNNGKNIIAGIYQNLFSYTILQPYLIKNFKYRTNISIRFAGREPTDNALKAIEKIYEILNRNIDTLNIKYNLKIGILMENKQITCISENYKVIIQGDEDNIVVTENNNRFSPIYQEYKGQKNIWGKINWFYKGKYLTNYRMAFNILDTFILFYPKE